MKLISCEKLEKSMVELQFSIDAETFKSAVNAAFKREGKKYAIPGFRKGKAPKAMIEKMYGKDLFQYDAINDLFPENYEAAVKEANIDVVGRPDAEVVSMSEDEGATLKVKVAVKPEVELGEYAGLTVNKDVKTVDEADVDNGPAREVLTPALIRKLYRVETALANTRGGSVLVPLTEGEK